MPRLFPKALFYRNGRPTRFGRWLNGRWASVFRLGILPSFLVTLEVAGRRSGRSRATALVAADYNGGRYLVSMLGENVDWVRNVRAASNRAVLRSGKPQRIRLEEVPVAERGPLLKAYYGRATGARWHFSLSEQSSVEEFQAVAAGYPVFRIVPE